MKIRYWGVRGSIPVPGRNTVRTGGNTPCVSVELSDGSIIVLDAGTGIRNLGRELMLHPDFIGGRGRAALLISHRHWDHIQGLPFFEPAYVAGNVFEVHAPGVAAGHTALDDNVVALSYTPANFPVSYETMKQAYRFHTVRADVGFSVGAVTVQPITLNHPGQTFGYVLSVGGGAGDGDAGVKMAYLSDTGPWDEVLGPHHGGRSERVRSSYYWSHVIPALAGADLVIHDTFFEVGRYEARADWGHSTPEHALRLCQDAGVQQLTLFHFAPDLEDDDVASMLRSARDAAGPIRVMAAVEGEEVVLGDGAVVSPAGRSKVEGFDQA
jgi:phosphoribosyl 1,2-cyclic phosphodiesterase